MNYALMVIHKVREEKVDTKNIFDFPPLVVNLVSNYKTPSKMIQRTEVGNVVRDLVINRFFFRTIEGKRDIKDELLDKVEKSLSDYDWYEVYLQVNHEDEGVTESNSNFELVRKKDNSESTLRDTS